VVPGHATLITGRKPKLFHELCGSQGLLTVEHHFPFIIDFHAAKGPQDRIGKPRRVAESMAQSLANGHAEFLELLASGGMLFPGIRQLSDASLLKDILAVCVGATTEEVRHATGHTVHLYRVHNERIKLVTTEFRNERIVVFQATSVELRVVIVELQDIG